LKRRTFLWQGSLLTGGVALSNGRSSLKAALSDSKRSSLFETFKNPSADCMPWVRWWWNGDKLEKSELSRELLMLKQAGIGGVEINPIKFPAGTNDIGKKSIQWLSTEWIDLLEFTFSEAQSLGMMCDLIVGSGWPFGAEWLQGEERSQILVIAAKRLEGPADVEISLFDLFKEADPAVSSPFEGRRMEMLSVKLVPPVLSQMSEVIDLSDQISEGFIKCSIPAGKFILYGLVKINGFMEVINGAPGASGPVLNHYNETAVKKYLQRMVSTISARIGPLSNKIRALFTDSMELEGANWCQDMASVFKDKKGYEIFPYLPFLLFRTGSMGNTIDDAYGASLSPELNDMLGRMRYDFECCKTEMIRDRFLNSFIACCRENQVQSRIQAYGRGYHPLEGSMGVDIPECETWIKNGLGTLMSEEDYRIGRAYSMVNKYVSSAAHLLGKRQISCEELTNTDRVFNETPELLKVAADQSIISGATHAVFHGFNYSPPDAEFPGWVRYGTFFNERHPCWPYFAYFFKYRARLSAILQQADMFADIAILPPIADMWSKFGAQNEPFPSMIYPAYQTLVWEAIHRNGDGCDLVSEKIIQDSDMRDSLMNFGPRKYKIIFLIEVESLEPATARKLFEFVEKGGRVFCIKHAPYKSLGWNRHLKNDEEVMKCMNKLKDYADRFILLENPKDHFIEWYRDIQDKFEIKPYAKISQPNLFISQVRYQTKEEEILFFANSSMEQGYEIEIGLSNEVCANRQGWLWDPESGERTRLQVTANQVRLNFGPADSRLLVFDRHKKGSYYSGVPIESERAREIKAWSIEWQPIHGKASLSTMDGLKDLKDLPDFFSFCGTILYRADLDVNPDEKWTYLNLGKIYGVSTLRINGNDFGVKWFGRRIYTIAGKLARGKNSIEISVTTTMGNYLKTLKDNTVAQYWTNEKRKNQPFQSMGMVGPVRLY
jgi:hypothetical protein